ncbi:regulatory protein GemA [Rhodoplanes azumiensis]|uniref:Regulatory protein GemA n=1 Tax=Rhodoplanes azumiensis TaxID=1897628 RepID=A0ABW5ANR3_9BRAD
MTREQLALVGMVKKHLAKTQGWDEDMYRLMLRQLGGVDSAKDLDETGFAQIMEYAASWGFRSDWRERTFGRRPGMATPRQVDLIRDLWREFKGADDDAGLDRWLDRSFGVSALRFATPEVAAKAINGLKAMNKRKAAKAAG